MAVHVTTALERQLAKLNESPDDLRHAFQVWKRGSEYSSYYFGKDGAYVSPRFSSGEMCLRHVHLAPIQDPSALLRWNEQWKRRSRKTSDRVLVYASDATHGHLLIYILQEPTAHDVAAMRTEAHALLMKKLTRIAERFVASGQIIG